MIGITNQRYKVWTPQGRILDKFIVFKEPEPKEEQSLTFFFFFIKIIPITMSLCYFICHEKNLLNIKTLN